MHHKYLLVESQPDCVVVRGHPGRRRPGTRHLGIRAADSRHRLGRRVVAGVVAATELRRDARALHRRRLAPRQRPRQRHHMGAPGGRRDSRRFGGLEKSAGPPRHRELGDRRVEDELALEGGRRRRLPRRRARRTVDVPGPRVLLRRDAQVRRVGLAPPRGLPAVAEAGNRHGAGAGALAAGDRHRRLHLAGADAQALHRDRRLRHRRLRQLQTRRPLRRVVEVRRGLRARESLGAAGDPQDVRGFARGSSGRYGEVLGNDNARLPREEGGALPIEDVRAGHRALDLRAGPAVLGASLGRRPGRQGVQALLHSGCGGRQHGEDDFRLQGEVGRLHRRAQCAGDDQREQRVALGVCVGARRGGDRDCGKHRPHDRAQRRLRRLGDADLHSGPLVVIPRHVRGHRHRRRAGVLHGHGDGLGHRPHRGHRPGGLRGLRGDLRPPHRPRLRHDLRRRPPPPRDRGGPPQERGREESATPPTEAGPPRAAGGGARRGRCERGAGGGAGGDALCGEARGRAPAAPHGGGAPHRSGADGGTARGQRHRELRGVDTLQQHLPALLHRDRFREARRRSHGRDDPFPLLRPRALAGLVDARGVVEVPALAQTIDRTASPASGALEAPASGI
mmetsp:Transcript_62659/g.175136  ORF Transcript_62659/g.175136 Transcript_62659/m.175136 type:complete len:621 (+) Transcript_62659:1766-3628(+)